MDSGIRVGNKKPSMTVDKSVSAGKPSVTEDFTPHNPTGSRTVTGGQPVYGMPLMSAAASKAK
jgi:hypothetical protein